MEGLLVREKAKVLHSILSVFELAEALNSYFTNTISNVKDYLPELKAFAEQPLFENL